MEKASHSTSASQSQYLSYSLLAPKRTWPLSDMWAWLLLGPCSTQQLFSSLRLLSTTGKILTMLSSHQVTSTWIYSRVQLWPSLLSNARCSFCPFTQSLLSQITKESVKWLIEQSLSILPSIWQLHSLASFLHLTRPPKLFWRGHKEILTRSTTQFCWQSSPSSVQFLLPSQYLSTQLDSSLRCLF